MTKQKKVVAKVTTPKKSEPELRSRSKSVPNTPTPVKQAPKKKQVKQPKTKQIEKPKQKKAVEKPVARKSQRNTKPPKKNQTPVKKNEVAKQPPKKQAKSASKDVKTPTKAKQTPNASSSKPKVPKAPPKAKKGPVKKQPAATPAVAQVQNQAQNKPQQNANENAVQAPSSQAANDVPASNVVQQTNAAENKAMDIQKDPEPTNQIQSEQQAEVHVVEKTQAAEDNKIVEQAPVAAQQAQNNDEVQTDKPNNI